MKRAWPALLAILLLGAALRIWGLDQGLPFTMSRPDEREALDHTVAFPTGDLDPGWLVYPNPFFWLLYAWIGGVLAIGRLVDPTLPDYATLLRERMGDAILVGRWLAALVGTGTIAIVWTLARRTAGTLAAVVAAALLAVCFLHVRDSHAMKADVFLTAAVPVVSALLARWVAPPTRGHAAGPPGSRSGSRPVSSTPASCWSVRRGRRRPCWGAARVATARAGRRDDRHRTAGARGVPGD